MNPNVELLNAWAEALEQSSSRQHHFDKSQLVQPVHFKYADETLTAFGVLVELFNKGKSEDYWIPLYVPGHMPALLGSSTWTQTKNEGKVSWAKEALEPKILIGGYGAMGSSGYMPDLLVRELKVWPSFLNWISERNYQNQSFKSLAVAIRNYDPEAWAPAKN